MTSYSRQHTIIAVIISSLITTLVISGIYILTTPSLKTKLTSYFTKNTDSAITELPRNSNIYNQDITQPSPYARPPTIEVLTPSQDSAPSIKLITSQPLVSSIASGVYNTITSIGDFLLNPLAYLK